MTAYSILAYMGISYIFLGSLYFLVDIRPEFMLGIALSSLFIVLSDLIIGKDVFKTFTGKSRYAVFLLQLPLFIGMLLLVFIPNLNVVRSLDSTEVSVLNDRFTLITFGLTLYMISSNDMSLLKRIFKKGGVDKEDSTQSIDKYEREIEKLNKEILQLKQGRNVE
ncbi:hypothetical protein EGH10_20845 [Brevibacillus laterosporus]|uniref:Uncharacterized protein n=1 Tax=Brevibacillus laterosporus LMG 15441 TaxID=1042163 RepID=A0A075RDF8_BRELA|nr:hypothetical protein [Brevibacillus laterosporus]AIG27440.1 hypothetical protein BRLA_c031280 [Brevibacillus laterosporus LMG 15441]RJL15367.1 hypothetical protein DM460_00270 [Brevibacillus laterosporus]TPH06469.1 hypothetical protein EGH10_20845 [Brevibacillus laterosporus]HAS01296.1 hypothetical protein [Brevibacillus sp.]